MPVKSPFTAFQPRQVYLLWPALYYTLSSNKLTAVFAYENREPGWLQYLNEVLLRNPYYDDLYPLAGGEGHWALVFDLSDHQTDVDKVLAGEYSQLLEHCKGCIRVFFGISTPEWVYMESFLNPENHFANYARLIEEPEELLRKIGELCDPPNLQREALQTPVKFALNQKRAQ